MVISTTLLRFYIFLLSVTLITATPLSSSPNLHSHRPLFLSPRQSNASTPACTPETSGLIHPSANTTIHQSSSDYSGTIVEILYCSSQYYETSSVEVDIWLTNPFSTSSTPTTGTILAKSQQPDNLDANAGFYSYRFNVTIPVQDGDHFTGQWVLGVYETTTGYYNPYNFEIVAVDVDLTVD